MPVGKLPLGDVNHLQHFPSLNDYQHTIGIDSTSTLSFANKRLLLTDFPAPSSTTNEDIHTAPLRHLQDLGGGFSGSGVRSAERHNLTAYPVL